MRKIFQIRDCVIAVNMFQKKSRCTLTDFREIFIYTCDFRTAGHAEFEVAASHDGDVLRHPDIAFLKPRDYLQSKKIRIAETCGRHFSDQSVTERVNVCFIRITPESLIGKLNSCVFRGVCKPLEQILGIRRPGIIRGQSESAVPEAVKILECDAPALKRIG